MYCMWRSGTIRAHTLVLSRHQMLTHLACSGSHTHRHRRKGLALEALQLFMAYLHQELGVTKFVAKIGADNGPSLALFEQRLGFTESRRVEVRAGLCGPQCGDRALSAAAAR